MWNYQDTDELYHYGVLGMKWGKRKAMPMSSTMANYQKAKAARKMANKAYNKSFNNAKNARKAAYKKAYNQVKAKSSLGDKLLYNNATRKKAARYMSDNNMSLKDARKKANSEAVKNTMSILAGIGAASLVTGAMNKTLKRR